jgi:hypothetical protein
MSEVIENSGIAVLTAGNTVDTLGGIDRDQASTTSAGTSATYPALVDSSASAPDPFAGSIPGTLHQPAGEPTVSNSERLEALEELLDEENTFDVSRAEFNELRDLALSISESIKQYNVGAPHKIPSVNINSVLGVK